MLLASLFLLLLLSESKDLDCAIAPVIGLYKTNDASTSKSADGVIFIKFMPEILNALLKVLAFQQSLSVMTLWHTGWCFLKLLSIHREGLHGDNLHLFNIVLEESSQHKDPLFLLELALHQQSVDGETSSNLLGNG